MPRSTSSPLAAQAAARLRALGADHPGPVPPADPGPGPGWVPVPGPAAGVPVRADGPVGLLHRLRASRYDPGLPGVAVLVVVAVAAAGLAAWFLLGSRPAAVPTPPVSVVEQPGTPAADGPAAAPAEPPGEVVVAVAGTVARPGVVRLPAGSRVVDAVEAAGGVLPGADVGLLNLARVLADGEQVLVGVDPPPGSAPGPAGADAPVTDAEGRLDLNRATVADLDGLPGVGPVLAQRIVEHRESAGRFDSVEQLREVEGIGESRFADLEPRVVVP